VQVNNSFFEVSLLIFETSQTVLLCVKNAQILGRWCVQKGFILLVKSSKQERMIENSQVFGFELTDQDMAALDSLTTEESLQDFKAVCESNTKKECS
jgi:diketogulonate reductase-like aldo/keto reductase